MILRHYSFFFMASGVSGLKGKLIVCYSREPGRCLPVGDMHGQEKSLRLLGRMMKNPDKQTEGLSL